MDAPDPVFDALRAWRTTMARQKQLPPYIVCTDAVLRLIAEAKPTNLEQLSKVRGFSWGKVNTYGQAILDVLAQAAPKPWSFPPIGLDCESCPDHHSGPSGCCDACPKCLREAGLKPEAFRSLLVATETCLAVLRELADGCDPLTFNQGGAAYEASEQARKAIADARGA